MSEIKLYRIAQSVSEMESSKVLLEKDLQNLIEDNMETFFGVRFLKTEFIINGGRMDSIGIDENNCPVIFEYKRSQNENVINQGLFYLDWLLDHKADFKLLVLEKLGLNVANSIDWSAPSVVCVAHEFTKYDLHAVNRMNVNIKLVKYRRYLDGLVLFEHLNTPSVVGTSNVDSKLSSNPGSESKIVYRTHTETIEAATKEIQEVYVELCNFIESLDDEISKNQLKYYLAYKKIRNFVCIEGQIKGLKLYLKLKPNEVELVPGYIRDVTNIGHYGTGDVEVTIKTIEDFEKAKALIERAYNES